MCIYIYTHLLYIDVYIYIKYQIESFALEWQLSRDAPLDFGHPKPPYVRNQGSRRCPVAGSESHRRCGPQPRSCPSYPSWMTYV